MKRSAIQEIDDATILAGCATAHFEDEFEEIDDDLLELSDFPLAAQSKLRQLTLY